MNVTDGGLENDVSDLGTESSTASASASASATRWTTTTWHASTRTTTEIERN